MAAETQLDRFKEILAKVTALQENQAVLIEKQNTSMAFLTNSMKDFTTGRQKLDAKMEQYSSRLSTSCCSNSVALADQFRFSTAWAQKFSSKRKSIQNHESQCAAQLWGKFVWNSRIERKAISMAATNTQDRPLTFQENLEFGRQTMRDIKLLMEDSIKTPIEPAAESLNVTWIQETPPKCRIKSKLKRKGEKGAGRDKLTELEEETEPAKRSQSLCYNSE